VLTASPAAAACRTQWTLRWLIEVSMGQANAGVRFRCPFCAKTFRASAGFIGRRWQCKRCARPFIAEALPDRTWTCDACGDADDEPTQYSEYIRIIAIVVLFHIKTVKGDLCRDCRKEYFWDYTLLSIALGVLGFPSCLFVPFIALANIFQHVRASLRALTSPILQAVQLPAAGMIVAAIINGAVGLVVVIVALSSGSVEDWSVADFIQFGLIAFALLAAPLVSVAARRMQRLQSLRLARIAAALMLVPAPAILVAVPCGIWSLVVLRRPEVVEVFR
jgi:hypothetical protein